MLGVALRAGSEVPQPRTQPPVGCDKLRIVKLGDVDTKAMVDGGDEVQEIHRRLCREFRVSPRQGRWSPGQPRGAILFATSFSCSPTSPMSRAFIAFSGSCSSLRFQPRQRARVSVTDPMVGRQRAASGKSGRPPEHRDRRLHGSEAFHRNRASEYPTVMCPPSAPQIELIA